MPQVPFYVTGPSEAGWTVANSDHLILQRTYDNRWKLFVIGSVDAPFYVDEDSGNMLFTLLAPTDFVIPDTP